MHEYIHRYQKSLVPIALTLGVLLALFLLAATLVKIKQYRFIGTGVAPANTITVTGTGDIEKAPDTARISFTVAQESKVVADAQQTVTTKVNAITSALEKLGIDSAAIKTDSYSSYPQYDYPPTPPCVSGTVCKSATPVLRGYQVAHAITVSVKDLTKVPDVLKVLGDNQVTDLSGPNFGFADDHEVANEARDAAIADAKNQAELLAKSLGVHLGQIVSFSEGNSGAPVPLYAAKDMATSAGVGEAPALPIGNQKVASTVTLVYEIR
ncbi:MAG TPA: SIMPL domain-containing protein [Candidatus Paceibacterota bacterium]|nr:SIMPL domain-containing protein [Candidatus Paceibacterota bacterium]